MNGSTKPRIAALVTTMAGALLWLAAVIGAAQPAQTAGTAVVLSIDGAIGPASADYVKRGLERAHEQAAAAVVLRIDTPGGLDTSMREIIRAVFASPIPVLSYVAPSGARAASAGTYILYASHVAAMAPGTNLGAATPVAIGGDGGGGSDSPRPAPSPATAPAGSQPGDAPAGTAKPGRSTSETKAVNDAVAYIRSLAELRGRNADWGERAVRESVSLPARDALDQKVIDLVADDIADLLKQAHGGTVRLGSGKVTLDTATLEVRHIEPDWRSKMLGVITNPNLALILMMVGVYGLLFEFMNPGALFPGVIGAISLLVGLYALSALPLDYAGAALLLLGLCLIVAEAFAPSFGILGIGGVVAFMLGASLLIDTETPSYVPSLPLLAGLALTAVATSLLVVRLAVRSRKRRVVSGTAAMIGEPARVLDWSGSAGHVFAVGERWSATGPPGLTAGQTVRVQAVHGLSVEVGDGNADAGADPRTGTTTPGPANRT